MLKNHPYVLKSSLAAVAILVVVAGVHAGSAVWWKNIQRSFGAPGGMVRLENISDGAAIHCASNGGNAIEAVGPVDISVVSGPPMFVSSSDRVTNLNADQLAQLGIAAELLAQRSRACGEGRLVGTEDLDAGLLHGAQGLCARPLPERALVRHRRERGVLEPALLSLTEVFERSALGSVLKAAL